MVLMFVLSLRKARSVSTANWNSKPPTSAHYVATELNLPRDVKYRLVHKFLLHSTALNENRENKNRQCEQYCDREPVSDQRALQSFPHNYLRIICCVECSCKIAATHVFKALRRKSLRFGFGIIAGMCPNMAS